MKFLILRLLTHSELGMFHEYRRLGKEGSKQRAINFDWDVVDRVFPAAKDTDIIRLNLRFQTDAGTSVSEQWLKRQRKNWRLEGNCPKDKLYGFVDPGCLFVMDIDSGRSPAIGAWGVLPAGDPATKAILANAESCALSGSSMIALHDDEGREIKAILRASRPDLFPGTTQRTTSRHNGESTAMAKVTAGTKRKQLPPDPTRLAEMLGSVGHTMPSAVADLIDNSITFDATEINITFGRPDAGHGRWMAIADNGAGMSSERLEDAMRIGGNSDYSDNSLGKYGFGLKGASWSQTKVFTVVTKEDGRAAHHLTWDAHDMGDWEVKSDPLEPWERSAIALKKHGTVVLWKDMKPPQAAAALKGLDPYSFEIAVLGRHLALVFHRFIEGRANGRKRVSIRINGVPIAANNPVGHPLVRAYDLKPVKIPTESGEGRVQVQAFLLPSEEEIEIHHKAEGPEAIKNALDRIGLYGKRNESQGLYIYRHSRLIKWGGWAQMWETNDEKTKLARVVVDFDKALDDVLKLNISKQTVQLPQQLQAEIKKLADVARKDSQKKFRRPKQPELPLPVTPGVLGGSDTNGSLPPGTIGGKPVPSSNPLASTDRAKNSPPLPKFEFRRVKTEKFLWKVSRSLTGSLEVQISEAASSLGDLVHEISTNPEALAHFVQFLSQLDRVDVQSMLLSHKASDQSKGT
jgi:hypothetical protein